MESRKQEITVTHNVSAHRFEAEVEGFLAVAEYERRANVMLLTHTFVPPELRGRGLAEKLVRAALDQARTDQVRVVPSCSYVAGFIQRHPEYQSLLG